jgi:hypothetical protein
MTNFIKINFNKPFYKKFNELIFTENHNIIYFDGSHMNYIYVYNEDNIEYTFNGFFKDDFFTIILDSYNKDLNINIENKFVILIKLSWSKIFIKDKEIYIIDNINNLFTHSFVLNIRKKINNLINISLDNYLKISNYTIIDVNINGKKNNMIIIDKLKKFLKL